ncbi:PqqD family protein [Shinella sp.]|uniref:PqqD family protein n=1 Tax=Shinella sp. TaxID=1870904 RepID=UPI003F6F3740
MNSITQDTILSLQQWASAQAVGDGAVVLLADSGQLYTGNATTEAILRQIDGQRRVRDLAALLCNEFDVSPEVVTGDIIEIAERLIDEGVIYVVE